MSCAASSGKLGANDRDFGWVALILLGLLLWGTAPAARAATIYSFTTLDVPGATATSARGLNDVGQIVGSYVDAAGTHGFVRAGTSYTTLDVPGATFTLAAGINDSGRIVGTYRDSLSHAFLTDDGTTYTPFNVSPSLPSHTSGNGINDGGRFVGGTDFGSDEGSSYWADSDNLENWAVFGSGLLSGSAASGVNNTGQIVGTICDFFGPGLCSGYLADGSSFTRFEAPGSPIETHAFDINNLGQIVVGTSVGGPSYLKEGDLYTLLELPGATRTAALGINDAGWIVGDYRDAAGTTHGFLAIPVPEPTTLTLLGGGLALLLAGRRVRGRG